MHPAVIIPRFLRFVTHLGTLKIKRHSAASGSRASTPLPAAPHIVQLFATYSACPMRRHGTDIESNETQRSSHCKPGDPLPVSVKLQTPDSARTAANTTPTWPAVWKVDVVQSTCSEYFSSNLPSVSICELLKVKCHLGIARAAAKLLKRVSSDFAPTYVYDENECCAPDELSFTVP